MPIYRLSNLAVLLVCSVLIAIAYYMQYVLYLAPCPLCMVQRIAVMLIGLWCLIAFVHNPARRGRMVYPIVLMILSLLGIVFAGRHVWLQHLPSDRIPECFPGLEFILANHPFTQALKIIFGGTGECAETQWTLLGISIPGWTLIAFIAISAVAVVQMTKLKRSA